MASQEAFFRVGLAGVLYAFVYRLVFVLYVCICFLIFGGVSGLLLAASLFALSQLQWYVFVLFGYLFGLGWGTMVHIMHSHSSCMHWYDFAGHVLAKSDPAGLCSQDSVHSFFSPSPESRRKHGCSYPGSAGRDRCLFAEG